MSITDLTALPEEELYELLNAVRAEAERRRTIVQTMSEIDRLSRDYSTAVGKVEGDPWEIPEGGVGFPKDWIVQHNGKTWRSTTPGNVWEPGVSGWREVAPESEGGTPAAPPEWVQPTGAHDTYKTGDMVTWQGRVYRSNRDGNVWSPSALPSGWDLVPTA